MKKLMLIFALLMCLGSCGGEEAHETGESDSPRPPKQSSDYTATDCSYTMTVGDGRREVVLAVAEEGECVTATVVSPEETAGVVILFDVAGARLVPPSAELTLSDEAAEGLRVFFDGASRTVSPSEYRDGAFVYTDGGYEMKLRLNGDGVVCELEATRDGYTRVARITELVSS